MKNLEILTPTKFIDPLIDFAFKKLFSSDPQKDLLIALLNEIFRGKKHIVDLVYNSNEHLGDIKEIGGASFDLVCTGDQGENFIVEVQKSEQKYFKERALFYTSRLISDQAPKGNRAAWKYNLKEVYLIAILENFSVDKKESKSYIRDIALCDLETGTTFYDKLGFIYIELINFVKSVDELETELDRWLYLLKHLSKIDKIPSYFRKPIFEKLFSIATYTGLTKKEKAMYDQALKKRWDNEAVMDFAIEKAELKGKLEGKLEVAKVLLERGMSLEDVAIITGISNEELKKL